MKNKSFIMLTIIFKYLKLLRWYILTIFFIIISTFFLADYQIEKATDNLIFNDINQIPYNRVGLLLGTSKTLGDGRPNQYFINRINAAAELYFAHKIDYIVISGDNSRIEYNEPMDMQVALFMRGVPVERIYLDYAGFRTYDAIVRINKIFGQTEFTVISQEFHNRRAIYISKTLNLNSIGFNAKDVDLYNGFKTKLREKFSRVNVFIDILIGKKPKFLGEKIEIQ